MRHYVPTLDALLDPKKLLPPMFAGEVDGLFEELIFHEWQVDFHAQSALQTGFDKEKIAAASATRNRRISRAPPTSSSSLAIAAAASGSLSGGKRAGERSGASTICPLKRKT